MRVNIPIMGLVFGLEDMLAQILGPAIVGQARLMLQGYENKSVETGQQFWELSRWVRSHDALKAALLAARVRDGAIEMESTPESAEFERRWTDFLETYGWRSDQFMEIASKTWREDPSTPLTQLKRYIAMEDGDDPFAMLRSHADTRERVTMQIEGQLPEPVRPQFRGMLAMAQQFLPISEDHNFTIDQKFTATMRFAALQVGAGARRRRRPERRRGHLLPAVRRDRAVRGDRRNRRLRRPRCGSAGASTRSRRRCARPR